MKSFTRRVRDLDRALFRALFGLKWAPLTAVMRAFTVAGTAGALWGFLAVLAFLFTGLEPLRLLIPWVAVATSWTVAEGAKYFFDRARPFLLAGDDRGAGEADEEAALEGARDVFDLYL